MGIALMFLLALYQMQSAIHSEIIETPSSYNDNSLLEAAAEEPNSRATASESDLLDGLMSTDNPNPEQQTELEFRYPISAIGIDYAKNSVVLRFQKHARKQNFKYDPDYEMKRKSLQDNFMHFGKRQAEQLPQATGPGYYEAVKRAAMDRYGRDPKQDFMRFGRAPPSDFMRFGRAPSDFMRFGRDPSQDFMRFGRSDNFMRFGRNLNFHEELRSPKQDFMRFGRPDNFMRFGRSAPTEFERNGKMDSNFMRFGKRSGVMAKLTKSQLQQNKLTTADGKQQPAEEGNPTDKAISMLFNKHQQQQQQQGQQLQQQQGQRLQQEERQQMKSSAEQNNLEEASVEQFYEP
ncbi:FMRFamide-related peptides [Drosophila virilis]|uniref:FMRFamide-related n=1 Tax=Drosophila virilis TaxID=7244 RepID=B4LP43_DROVI|nr:FMRFamide-related peptides [Drosophila virilis]EDW62237.1 FMRFamide-related [Drosophila virilis]